MSLEKVTNFNDLLEIGMKRADARLLFNTASGTDTGTPSAPVVQEKAEEKDGGNYTWEKCITEVEEYLAEQKRHSAKAYGTRAFVRHKRKAYSDTRLYRWSKVVPLAVAEGLDLAAMDKAGVTVTERSLLIYLGRNTPAAIRVVAPAAAARTARLVAKAPVINVAMCV